MHANNLEKTVLAYAKAWHHVDASGRTLGKLAERIATVLMGKHKPIFDPGGASLKALMSFSAAEEAFAQWIAETTLW